MNVPQITLNKIGKEYPKWVKDSDHFADIHKYLTNKTYYPITISKPKNSTNYTCSYLSYFFVMPEEYPLEKLKEYTLQKYKNKLIELLGELT